MNLTINAIACTAFLVSLAITGQFLKYALAKGLLDTPNERSSHVRPTPRGGGVAIVIASLLAIAVLGLLREMSWRTVSGLLSAGAIAAAIGYLDDRKQVSLGVRLAGQFASAACAVWLLGSAPVAIALGIPTSLAALVIVLGLLYVVWMLNLTNFMDGIDGIASVEVITACLGVVLCLWASPSAGDSPERRALIGVALVVAASSGGFLEWNWPPARIFMGDAGSGFLGVMLASLSILAAAVHPDLFWATVILCGVFIVDATVTLFRRIARREKFYNAHRSHAYQHASRRWNHKRVTVGVGVINVCWLLPWAVLAARGSIHGALALTLAYVPLVISAVRMRAGLPE